MAQASRSRCVPRRSGRTLTYLGCLLVLFALTGCGGSSTSHDFNYVGNKVATTNLPMEPRPKDAAKPIGDKDAKPAADKKDGPAPPAEPAGSENYERIFDNPFFSAETNPPSTFSISVDTASYSNVRRFLNHGQLPPKDAVRIADLVNYFHYDYPQPKDEHPVSFTVDLSQCPWNSKHHLVRVGLHGRII